MRTVDEWQVCFMELLRVRRAAPLTAELGDARAEGEAAMRTVDEWQVCSLDKGDSMNEVHVFDDILEAQGFLVGLPAPVCHEGGIWEGRHIMRHVVRHYRGEVTVAEQKRATVAEQKRVTVAEQERATVAEQERVTVADATTKEVHDAISAMCQRLGADFEWQPCDVGTLERAVESVRRIFAELVGERGAGGGRRAHR